MFQVICKTERMWFIVLHRFLKVVGCNGSAGG